MTLDDTDGAAGDSLGDTDQEATGPINHNAGPSNVIIVTNLSRDVLTCPADIALLKAAFEDADVVERMQPFSELGRVCAAPGVWSNYFVDV